ncbi:MAG: peptidylprolyl isomerase [Deltaproteobacteria bacterium]|nr:peptidylprolyl isomerase [Deltaproteobacteria bacterium]
MRNMWALAIGLFGSVLAATGSVAHAADNPVVVMKTSKGVIEIELDKAKAPVTVENFLAYTNDKFYDGTTFHRVIPTFMIQGGGFTPDMKQKPTKPPIKNEAANGLKNVRGSIAMARTSDPNSATAQFFINVVDNPNLDYRGDGPMEIGYAVFGKVTKGMEVVDAIKAVPTTTKPPFANVPVDAVIIESVTLKK